MNEVAFVSSSEEDWKRLYVLCGQKTVGVKSMTPDQVDEFIRLYRKASSDLAAAQTESANDSLIEYLNDLVAMAYGTLYENRRKTFGEGLRDAILSAAQTARRRWVFLAASFAIFFGSWAVLFGAFEVRPDVRDGWVQDSGMTDLFEHWKSLDFKERPDNENMLMAGFYASNNPRVAVIAGSIGASTFGVGTTALLVQNGLILAALSSEMNSVGRLGKLFLYILPHGVPELSGVLFSGAAGLLFGWALIFPGRKTRGDALREAAKDAIPLLGTAVTLMFIAAPIEGFFSFNPNIPDGVKFAVIVVELLAWSAFWIRFGRAPENQPN